MRAILPLVVLIGSTAVAAATIDRDTAERGLESSPPFAEPLVRELKGPPGPGEAVCRDTIHSVRAERGLPALERGTADPDEPYFIAAVDKRIGGCSVMVMRNDTSDVRPLPKPDNRTTLRPAQ